MDEEKKERLGYIEWMYYIKSVHYANISAMSKGLERLDSDA